LHNEGNRRFQAINNRQSGVAISGEIREAVLLPGKKQRLLVGRNNAAAVVLE
jgi:hypothetical protein